LDVRFLYVFVHRRVGIAVVERRELWLGLAQLEISYQLALDETREQRYLGSACRKFVFNWTYGFVLGAYWRWGGDLLGRIRPTEPLADFGANQYC
jgi:hypothetical protein